MYFRMSFFVVLICWCGFAEVSEEKTASQIETTPLIREIVLRVESVQTPEDLKSLRFIMMYNLNQRKYSRHRRGHEQRIRWRRTATQIFEDAFVYRGHCDADMVVAFLALCKARNIKGRFVKVWKNNQIYSLAEVQLDTTWYIFDVASSDAEPVMGVLGEENDFNGWKLWKKGRDSWDIGLMGYQDRQKMCDVLNCQYDVVEKVDRR